MKKITIVTTEKREIWIMRKGSGQAAEPEVTESLEISGGALLPDEHPHLTETPIEEAE